MNKSNLVISSHEYVALTIEPHPRLKCHPLLFKKRSIPASFSLIFVVSNNNNNLTTNKCENCPSSIRCRHSNPRPWENESPPITTRLGLSPKPLFLSLRVKILDLLEQRVGFVERHEDRERLLHVFQGRLRHLRHLLRLAEQQHHPWEWRSTLVEGGWTTGAALSVPKLLSSWRKKVWWCGWVQCDQMIK